MEKRPTRRLNVNLPAETYDQLSQLAADSHRSMSDVVRTALSLVKIALEEEKKNRTLAVAEDDKLVKQIVLTH